MRIDVPTLDLLQLGISMGLHRLTPPPRRAASWKSPAPFGIKLTRRTRRCSSTPFG
jgi:hypothetical protein